MSPAWRQRDEHCGQTARHGSSREAWNKVPAERERRGEHLRSSKKRERKHGVKKGHKH